MPEKEFSRSRWWRGAAINLKSPDMGFWTWSLHYNRERRGEQVKKLETTTTNANYEDHDPISSHLISNAQTQNITNSYIQGRWSKKIDCYKRCLDQIMILRSITNYTVWETRGEPIKVLKFSLEFISRWLQILHLPRRAKDFAQVQCHRTFGWTLNFKCPRYVWTGFEFGLSFYRIGSTGYMIIIIPLI